MVKKRERVYDFSYSRYHIMPSWSRAASDILLGSQGGSQTRSIFTSETPGMAFTYPSISAGID